MTAGASGIPLHRRMFKMGAKDTEHRAPRSVGTNPISWREATARNATAGRIIGRWAFVILGCLFAVVMVGLFRAAVFGDPGLTKTQQTFRTIVLSTAWTETAIILLIAINMAATAVSREREDGTLDLLLTTPITPKQYLTGKLRGLIAYILPMLAVPIATLLAAGVPILQALEITADTVNNGPIADAVKDVQDSVREGESIAAPLSSHDIFPPMVVQMIAVGEETGNVDGMLEKIADFYDTEVESMTESLTALMEPLMIGVIGGLVGGMVIALYLPMFQIFDLIE
jgi:type II secretory pathway component PulF